MYRMAQLTILIIFVISLYTVASSIPITVNGTANTFTLIALAITSFFAGAGTNVVEDFIRKIFKKDDAI